MSSNLEVQKIREDYLRACDTRRLANIDDWVVRAPVRLQSRVRVALIAAQAELRRKCVEQEYTTALQSIDVEPSDSLGSAATVTLSGLSPTVPEAWIAANPLCGLSKKATEALLDKFERVSFQPGEFLLHQGQQAEGLYVLIAGRVDVQVVATAGVRTIDESGPGDLLGEMSLVTGQPCAADVVATRPTRALMLRVGAYEALRRAHPEIEILLSHVVSQRLGNQKFDALCDKTVCGYRLVRCINRGGMGVVYEGWQEESQQCYAVKMLRHRFIYDETAIKRFLFEAALLKRLNHPRIIRIRNSFVAYNTRFLVVDLCCGNDLRQVLRERGAIPESDARRILAQVAQGLAYAHQENVIHLDLKPSNVLVDERGDVLVSDFGLGQILDMDPGSGSAVGTPIYMAPEQMLAGRLGPQADWYAFACMAYELLEGRRLFNAENLAELLHKKSTWSSDQLVFDHPVSDELAGLIRGGLAPDPHHRQLDLARIAAWAPA